MTDNLTPSGPRYAGFWKRLLAFFIDTLILVTVFVTIAIAIYGRRYVQLSSEGQTLLFDIVVQGVLPAVAAILFWRYRGATPGKMLVSARIVDAETLGAPSTGKLIGRYFAYIDKLAGTVVILEEDDD
jgi:uncharacterized RDD family membrane protein YckC